MDEVLEHLNTIIDEAEQAQNKAPLGTSLMVREIATKAERLRDRVENILEEDDAS